MTSMINMTLLIQEALSLLKGVSTASEGPQKMVFHLLGPNLLTAKITENASTFNIKSTVNVDRNQQKAILSWNPFSSLQKKCREESLLPFSIMKTIFYLFWKNPRKQISISWVRISFEQESPKDAFTLANKTHTYINTKQLKNHFTRNPFPFFAGKRARQIQT